MATETIKINVPVLARVEGEGALDVTIENQQITQLKLRIFEPPRYFEKFLEGRNYYDVPDVVARICGICPVAYQMSASYAIEAVFDIKITPWIRAMRRLFYCGEWLQSHSLHIHLLAAPDFLGFNNAIEMAAKYSDEVKRGLKLQALGNDMVALFGARSVHPVGVRVGGFSKSPTQSQVDDLLQRVRDAIPDAINIIRWLDDLDLPDDEQEFISVALHHDDEYPFNEGCLISDSGLNIPISEFENHFKETHVDHSTALHCLLDGKPYLVGPLARINLNATQLPDEIKSLMRELRAQFPSKNMFHSIIARAIEIYFSLLEAEQLLADYTLADQPCMPVTPRAGVGYGCTEAPRGILWHRYEMDDRGCVVKATIVPPTSQNQPRIEEDLKNALINFGLDNTKADLQLHAEKVIRNYDPCISCATHFLDLKLVRDGVVEKEKIALDVTLKLPLDPVTTAIIGIGSPNEGDDAGWNVIDALQQLPEIKSLINAGLEINQFDRPGVVLHAAMQDKTAVIIVDAVRSVASDKAILWINGKDILRQSGLVSSHDLELAGSLSLLKQLEALPENIYVLGLANNSRELRGDAVRQIIQLFKNET